ncbi:MAG: NADH-quinone oxidoreductase subunit J [Pyrinomonadaceae bacterium]
MFTLLFFILFGSIAVGCALAVVIQRNPLYSAISLVGVFLSLACLYVMLAAPFIAAVQVIVYAGAIMVLVIFVIMLLNVDDDEHRIKRPKHMVPAAIVFAIVLLGMTLFMINATRKALYQPPSPTTAAAAPIPGLTANIGEGLFTKYLLPFEITSLLLLMAMVGAMSLARRGALPTGARIVPGSQVLPRHLVEDTAFPDQTAVETDSTAEAAVLLGFPQTTRGNGRNEDSE